MYVFHPFLQPRGSKSLSHPLLEIEKACIREFRVCTLLLLLYICIIHRGGIVSMILSHIILLSYLLMKKGNFRLLIWNQHDRVSIRRSVELGKKAVNNVSRLI